MYPVVAAKPHHPRKQQFTAPGGFYLAVAKQYIPAGINQMPACLKFQQHGPGLLFRLIFPPAFSMFRDTYVEELHETYAN